MKRSRFTEEQIVGILLQVEAAVRVDAERFSSIKKHKGKPLCFLKPRHPQIGTWGRSFDLAFHRFLLAEGRGVAILIASYIPMHSFFQGEIYDYTHFMERRGHAWD